MKKNTKFINYLFFYTLFFLLFLTGVLTYKDYGIGIDDKFHRLNGFYWLDYLLSFTNFTEIKSLVKIKLNSINDYTLPSITNFNKYSIIFDVPAAVIELILKLENVKQFYEVRHLLNFLFFFIGCIYFYKILLLRFNNLISFFGCALFILSPRIYGESFYNMKDIIFLTFLVIGYYYSLKCFLFFKIKDLLILSLISAICIQIRIIGLALPLSFFSFYLLSLLARQSDIKHITKIIFFIVSTCLLIVITWPYLWSSPLNNFLSLFQNWVPSIFIFFNGDYIQNDFLPYSYIPVWILITTPIFHSIMFIIGFLFILKRLYLRLIEVENKKINYDLWNGVGEKFDVFITLNFLILMVLVIFLNVRLFNSWKHLYFINFYIIYIATFSLNFSYIFFRKKKMIKLFISVTTFFLVFTAYQMFKYHPYQGLYFNSLISNDLKNKFEIDFTALTARHFFNKIFSISNQKSKINIATASWAPLHRTLEIFSEAEQGKINLVGQNYKEADYIYTNHISEVDKRMNNKYHIPSNFYKIFDFEIDGAILYTIYKKND